MRIIFIRHGQSMFNVLNDGQHGERFFSGQLEAPLTKIGEQQARALRRDPRLVSYQQVVSSDLVRAKETARLATGRGNIPTDSRLRERSLGILEGKYLSQVDDLIPGFMANYPTFAHSYTQRIPGGESYQDIEQRAADFLSEVLDHQQDLAVFSHFCWIRSAIRYLTNMSEAQIMHFQVPNCTPIVLEGKIPGDFTIIN